MKKLIKDFGLLLGAGVVFWLGILLVKIIIGLVLAFPLSLFFEIDYFILALFCYLGISFIEALLDFGESSSKARCPECKRKIQTTLSVKCEVCGGAALITAKEQRKMCKDFTS